MYRTAASRPMILSTPLPSHDIMSVGRGYSELRDREGGAGNTLASLSQARAQVPAAAEGQLV